MPRVGFSRQGGREATTVPVERRSGRRTKAEKAAVVASRPTLINERPCAGCGGAVECGTGCYVPDRGLLCDGCVRHQ